MVLEAAKSKIKGLPSDEGLTAASCYVRKANRVYGA
jgi:hypothetical protein